MLLIDTPKKLFESPNQCFLSSENRWLKSGPVYCLVRETQHYCLCFNANRSFKHGLPLAEESKQLPAQSNLTPTFADVGPGSASTLMPHTCAWAPAPPWVPRQPWAGALRTTLFPNKHPHPAPRQGLPLPLFWHLVGSLWRMAHIFPPQGAVVWDPGDLALVCICLLEEEDLRSQVLRVFGAGGQRGVFKLVEPIVPT